MGPAVISPYLEHPSRVAAYALTLQALSGGRASVGVGRGSQLELAGLRPPRGPRALGEAAHVLRHLLEQREGGVDGTWYSVDARLRLPWGRAGADPVHFWGGTSGERTARALAPYVDTLVVSGLWQPAQATQFSGWLAEAAPPDAAPRLGAAVWTIVCPSHQEALALGRQQLAMRVPFLQRFMRDGGMDPAEIDRVTSAVRHGGIAAGAGAVSDVSVERFCGVGSPETFVERILQLHAAGVRFVNFSGSLGESIEDAVRFLGEQVLPDIRAHIPLAA